MPLRRGRSRAAISENISQLVHEGYSQAQAVAIAMRTAGIPKKGRKTMAKRRRKHGKRKSGHRKNPRRVAAARRAYKKSGLYKYNLRKKGKKRRGGKRRRRTGRKARRHGSKRRRHARRSGGLSIRGHQVYQTLINRGRTPQQAHKVAKRLDRIRTGKAKRYFEREAVQAKNAQQLSNVFAGIGSAGRLAAMGG
jgi:hypothetical protein